MLHVDEFRMAGLAVALTMAGLPALAAGPRPVSLHISGATTLVGQPIRPFVQPPAREPGLIKIFDNLPPPRKYPYGTYFCCYGTAVAGPENGYDPEQWWAEAFTPNVNANVTKIDVAITYMAGGTNGVNIALYTNANGEPGTPLISRDVSNLPPFGSCCSTMRLEDRQGVAVTAGTQYWVVLSTDSNNASFLGSWDYNGTDQVTKINQAINLGSGWQAGSYYPGVGMAVWGK